MIDTTIVRSAPAGLRASGEGRTLYGYFSRFNTWAEIDDWEGRFLERIAPGAFARTFREDRARIKVLFQHGRDPMVGMKPLGPLLTLREDDIGALYEVPLLEASYTADLIPGLREGLYGASFRFKVMVDELRQSPGASPYNPDGLPERTIREVKVREFGPVTFPAYQTATAGVRGTAA